MRQHFALSVTALSLSALAGLARADSTSIGSSRDSTLYQDLEGDIANGAGSGMFAGRNAAASNSIRRGLIWFDIASAIPAGATINSVTLSLSQSAANMDDASISLHRALQSWGEGSSVAGMGGGGGTVAAANDATWVFRFFPGDAWSTPGGSFTPLPSASTTVAGAGTYDWSSTGLVADVQSFLDAPIGNFGWAVLGNESAPSTSKRFATREESQTELRPMLLVDYTPVPAPAGAVVLASAGLALSHRRRMSFGA